MTATSASGTVGLDRVGTSALGFAEAIDGDGFTLSLPLGEQLLKQSIVLVIGDAEAATFFPEKKLFGSGEEGVPEVEFQGSSVSVPVGNGVNDSVPGNLIGPVLNHVAEHQGFIVAQQSLVEVGLDAAGDFLERVFGVSTLDFLEVSTRTS
jgi:hypothetical protein